jgi:HD superfamily phosphohydrolase
MSYQYQSYTTKSSSDGTRVTSVVIHEISEAEASEFPLEEKSHYEVLNEDQLTGYDFLSLIDSEDDDDTESDSDIEQYWFPSLLKSSIIQFLEDDDLEELTDDDNKSEAIVEEDEEQEEDDGLTETDVVISSSGKRSPQYKFRQRKKVKRPEQIPVEVYHIVL